MKLANSILLKALGMLLLTAAVLKGWQLINEPLANNNIWSSRWFHIMIVEFELAMGIWLVSGVLKKAAWLATLGVFSLFFVITLYKGITGYTSCGCFGQVHVNPWVTLLVIDVPCLLLLLMYRASFFDIKQDIVKIRHIGGVTHTIIVFGFICLTIAFYTLDARGVLIDTGKYLVLKPDEWVGKKLPIMESIDPNREMRSGEYDLVFIRGNCTKCSLNKLSSFLENKTFDIRRKVYVQLPPHTQGNKEENDEFEGDITVTVDTKKTWVIETPTIIKINNGYVQSVNGDREPHNTKKHLLSL